MIAATIRPEHPCEREAIARLVTSAFEGHPYSDGSEARIIETLREDRVLLCSLVAVQEGEIVGHVAFSPVAIDGMDLRWAALAPLSVRPDAQRRGIGSALVEQGLSYLRENNVAGCVLVGERRYYARFGFRPAAALRTDASLQPHLMVLGLNGAAEPEGALSFHAAFSG